MHFKNYEYFLAIVEEGSLSKAAQRLYITQPSLSKYLKRLEMNLGVELFERTSSPLKLNYTGERYYNYIKKVITLDKQMQKEFADIKNDKQGKIQMGLALWRGSILLPAIIPSFLLKYPNIEINIIEGSGKFLRDKLINEKLDFAIINLTNDMDFSNLNYETIMHEQILLLGNKNHPLVNKFLRNSDFSLEYPYFNISTLEDELFIMTKDGQSLTSAVMSVFSKRRVDPKKKFETENLSTAINLVSAGMGFTFIPEGGVKGKLLPDNIAVFSLNEPELFWVLAVVYKKDSYITNVSRLLINMIKEHYSNGI